MMYSQARCQCVSACVMCVPLDVSSAVCILGVYCVSGATTLRMLFVFFPFYRPRVSVCVQNKCVFGSHVFVFAQSVIPRGNVGQRPRIPKTDAAQWRSSSLSSLSNVLYCVRVNLNDIIMRNAHHNNNYFLRVYPMFFLVLKQINLSSCDTQTYMHILACSSNSTNFSQKLERPHKSRTHAMTYLIQSATFMTCMWLWHAHMHCALRVRLQSAQHSEAIRCYCTKYILIENTIFVRILRGAIDG